MKRNYSFLTIELDDHNNIIKVSEFISKYQKSQYFIVGNFPISKAEIENQLRVYLRNQPHSLFYSAKADFDKVRGFLGAFFSDPNTIRMVGPFATNVENERNEISEMLFEKILEKYAGFESVKFRVAFTMKNLFLKQFYESHGFRRYNAETTLEMKLPEWQRNKDIVSYFKNTTAEIRAYRQSDFNAFLSLHPQAAYFTAKDIVQNLNDQHHLIMAILNEQVVGYVYYEKFESDELSDICFINVLPSARNKGIGSMLLCEAIKNSFVKNRIKKIIISVRVENASGLRLYKRIGFKKTATFLAYELKL
jgi:ribosomal protein S18 acetylase RimI-like enzyme